MCVSEDPENKNTWNKGSKIEYFKDLENSKLKILIYQLNLQHKIDFGISEKETEKSTNLNNTGIHNHHFPWGRSNLWSWKTDAN